jgi:hypothetical protein
VVIQEFSRTYHVSLHFAAGHAWFQHALMVASAALAISLTRARTSRDARWASLGSWVLLVSLHARNTMVLHSGDKLLRLMLFWNTLLAWSPGIAAPVAAAALLVQSALVYVFTAILKSGEAWRSGEAVYLSLTLMSHATPLAAWLSTHRELCELLTFSVWWFEVGGTVLLFAPIPHPLFGPVRTLVLLNFALMHVGFGLCLRLGIFGLVSTVALLPFLPAWFWDNIAGVGAEPQSIKSSPTMHLPAEQEPQSDLDPVSSVTSSTKALHGSTVSTSRHTSTITGASAGGLNPGPNMNRSTDGTGSMRGADSPSLIKKRGGAGSGAERSESSLPRGWLDWLAQVRAVSMAAVSAFFLVYILWWNVGTVHPSLAMPASTAMLGTSLWINQKWDMFAPSPPRDSGW